MAKLDPEILKMLADMTPRAREVFAVDEAGQKAADAEMAEINAEADAEAAADLKAGKKRVIHLHLD